MLRIIFSLVTLMISLVNWVAIGAERTALNVKELSSLPITGYEIVGGKANLILIVGGKGIRNIHGKSKNFLVRFQKDIAGSQFNTYVFPNKSKKHKSTYAYRNSKEQIKRLTNFVKLLKSRNGLPTFIVGFSRGSVDAGSLAVSRPNLIDGIVLISGVYENESRKASNYAMEEIIGERLKTPILVIHHEDDECHVTSPDKAQSFFNRLEAIDKTLKLIRGGEATGRKCGPFHKHGLEGIELKAVSTMTNWAVSQIN